ncbi:Tetra-peptide repeat homeobox protein 1 [Entomophthora muscae]|uniref:Tetra-peptide repeat homeobox protein 1 n=1 Tax=Entomophthora muscae TaxID=34485 RepID=A0ACC2TN64_9FUNG|nr:Tetra-peptide repeat homeobox protein 1 [Entomophthora muscae]
MIYFDPVKKTHHNSEQRQLLESFYQLNSQPSSSERELIAQRLQLEAHQVSVWFQNRRARERKCSLPTLKIDPRYQSLPPYTPMNHPHYVPNTALYIPYDCNPVSQNYAVNENNTNPSLKAFPSRYQNILQLPRPDSRYLSSDPKNYKLN